MENSGAVVQVRSQFDDRGKSRLEILGNNANEK